MIINPVNTMCKGLAFSFENEIFTFKLMTEKLNQDKIIAFKDLAYQAWDEWR
jgi:hypothetical protein